MKVTTKLTLVMATFLAGALATAALDLYEIHVIAESTQIVRLADSVQVEGQKIVRLELSGERADASMREVTRVLRGLIEGDPTRRIPRIRRQLLRREVLGAEASWEQLRAIIFRARTTEGERGAVLSASEDFFHRANRVAQTAITDTQSRTVRHRRIVVALALLAAALVAGAWRIIQRDITRPIAELAEKARMIPGGELQVRFGPGGEDEVGVLARCLDSMVSGLQAMIRELSDAKAAAEAANQAKSEFLARMGHELRSPLNAVLGYTDLVLDGVEGPINAGQRESLERVRARGQQLLQLIDRVLAYSRLATGQAAARPVPFDLAGALGGLTPLKSLAERKGLAFSIRISEGVPEKVVGDAAGVLEVLQSLVDNAVKFTDRGEVEVRVERESESEKGVSLHFAVRDTGPGISPEQQSVIFEGFYQAEAASTRIHAGMGLGLTTAALWAQHLGGRLSVKSRPGEGSTFYFVVPFEKSVA